MLGPVLGEGPGRHHWPLTSPHKWSQATCCGCLRTRAPPAGGPQVTHAGLTEHPRCCSQGARSSVVTRTQKLPKKVYLKNIHILELFLGDLDSVHLGWDPEGNLFKSCWGFW